MRFKLDENIPDELATELVGCGHDVHTCRQEGLQGTADPEVLEHSRREGRIVITFDLDFSDIRRFPPGSYPGIILLRLQQQDIDTVKAVVSRLLSEIPADDLLGNLVIVDENRYRVRRPSETA